MSVRYDFRENIDDENRESCVLGVFVFDFIVYFFLRNLV